MFGKNKITKKKAMVWVVSASLVCLLLGFGLSYLVPQFQQDSKNYSKNLQVPTSTASKEVKDGWALRKDQPTRGALTGRITDLTKGTKSPTSTEEFPMMKVRLDLEETFVDPSQNDVVRGIFIDPDTKIYRTVADFEKGQQDIDFDDLREGDTVTVLCTISIDRESILNYSRYTAVKVFAEER